jgi:hypothetical protein
MAMKLIEAQAVITAADRTGKTFEVVAGKVRGLQSAMKSLGSVPAGAARIPQTLSRIDSGYKSVSHAIMATAAAHKALQAVHKVVETYKEYDDIVRYQRAITGMTEGEQEPFIKQAIHLGGSTPFNDIKVLHAQLDLVQRGVDKNFITPMVEMAADYAQAMNADLGESTKTIEGILFSTRKHIEDGNEALKVAKRTVDYAVKLAKIGGLDNEDITQLFKYAGMSGAMAGLSDETIGAIAAMMRRSNIRGDEAGVAIRAMAGALVAPTQKGQAALTAMGIDYGHFTKMPNGLSVDRLGLLVKQTFGKELTPEMRERLASVFANGDIIGDRGEFTVQTSKILEGLFTPGKNGKLKAQDSHNLAKAVGGFHKLAIESVDTEGLLRAIMEKQPTLALANAMFGVKQGSRVLAALGNPTQFNEFWTKLKEAPEGFAHGIAEQRMAGFSGAVQRSEGALMNLWTALGRANDPILTGGFDKAARFIQSLAELNPEVLKFGTDVAAAGTAVIAFTAAMKVFQAINTLASGVPPAGMVAAGAAARGGLPLWLIGSIGMGGYELARAANDMVWSNPKLTAPLGEGGMLGALSGDYALGAAIANLPQPELKGNITLKIEAPPGFSVSASGNVPGVRVGTTGSTGKSLPEAGGEGW